MSSPRKICVVTGSRAEYGLLYWVMKEIASDENLQLQIVATGMHLSPEFGLTYRQIESDGFKIDARVEMLLSADTPVAITKSMGLGVIGFADTLNQLAPDIMVVLGDRFEILAAAQAAMLARVPIAHIHGGETTEGAYDEGIRHAITKMAQWHFVAAEPYRKRVVQLGESPDRVFNFGAPGLDHISRIAWLSRTELEAALGIHLAKPLFLVTYHPATLSDSHTEQVFDELLIAMGQFPEVTIIFTYPNADTDGRVIIRSIDDFVSTHQKRAKAFISLGQKLYLSLMKEADVIIGNSSSGLTEAPAMKKATVNIGDRQKGRLKATSVIDAAENREDIAQAIHKALSDTFRKKLPETISLYGIGDAGKAIVAQLKKVLPRTQKTFFDIPHRS